MKCDLLSLPTLLVLKMQGAIFPIREISTYNGRNWTIRGRVTMESAIRSFTNDRGNGKVFSVDLLDKDGGEIKGSFFNQSVDKFFDQIESGKIYTFSKGMPIFAYIYIFV